MYQWQQDKRDHAHMLYSHLKTAVDNYWTDGVQTKLQGQKSYADVFYSWEYRKHQWESLLQNILEEKGIKVAIEQRDSTEPKPTTAE